MSCSDKGSIEEKIKDITDCPICLDVCKDPKILPCIHTFCMNCLLETGRKLKKNPRDTMPCPVCRREFAIPETGFGGLQKNFFMEKLTEMRQILKPSSSIILCEPCSEEGESNVEGEIPSAEMYCVDCHQKLCQECCRNHRKYKVSKHHKIIPVEAAQQVINVDEAFKTDNCEKHVSKPLEIYCSECEEVVCSMCFIERHSCHKGLDVNKVASDINTEVQKNVEYWSSFLPQLDEKKQELDKYDANVICKVEEVESEIFRKRQELKQLVVTHSESILRKLELLKQHQLKKCNTLKNNIEALFASVESYKVYCLQMTKFGSASDLCKAKSILDIATKELQQRQALTDESSLKSFDVSLKITDLQNYLRQRGFNIIGNLVDSDDSVSRRRISDAQPEDVDAELMDNQNPLDPLSHWEDGKTKPAEDLEPKTGDEVNEQNMLVDDVLKVHLTDETKDLATQSDKLQELQQKVENMSTTINRLNHDLDIERLHVKELEQERDLLCARTKDCESNDQTIRNRVKDLEEQVALLKGLVYDGEVTKTAKDTINWMGTFTPFMTLETFYDARVKHFEIFGIAILGNELFVASSDNVVVIHDLKTLKFKRRWKLPRTGEEMDDLKQCNANKCLYLVKVDSKTYNEIIRLDLKGKEIAAWSIEKLRGPLTVTRESNVLLTVSSLNQLHEYAPDGKLIQIIHIPWNSGIEYPLHAIKLTSDHFLVCHGDRSSRLSRVCIVDISGDVIKSFGEPRDNGLLNGPLYMDIDGAGNVLVLDYNCSRILLLSGNLEFRQHVYILDGSISRKMALDESNRRVFILPAGMLKQVHVYNIENDLQHRK